MLSYKFLPFGAAVCLAAGCATSGANYTPILDGPPRTTFAADLQACQTLARSQFGDEIVAVAVMAAGLGALAGLSDESVTEGEGLVGGLIGGAAIGAVSATIDVTERRESIVIRCMEGRGHAVVG